MSRPIQKYKTCKRWNEPGHAHELTFSCFHRLPLLSRDRSREWFVKAVNRARANYRFDIWAYVIMPEHVHMLICPRDSDYDISPILGSIKWPVSIKAKRYVRRYAPHWLPRLTDKQPNGRSSFRFWQRGGGYDRNARADRTLGAMIDYIHANPVRRGLVERPEQWRWSSAAWYDGERDVPLLMDDTIM